MAQPQSSISKLVEKENEQQRIQRVRVEEQKRIAARTAEELQRRFGK